MPAPLSPLLLALVCAAGLVMTAFVPEAAGVPLDEAASATQSLFGRVVAARTGRPQVDPLGLPGRGGGAGEEEEEDGGLG